MTTNQWCFTCKAEYTKPRMLALHCSGSGHILGWSMDDCETVWESEQDMKDHINSSSTQCYSCNFNFECPCGLHAHNIECHDGKVSCEVCKRFFRDRTIQSEHTKAVHKFIYSLCDGFFQSKKALSSQDCVIRCCSRDFLSKDSLQQHILMIHAPLDQPPLKENLKCPEFECDFKFPTSADHGRHMITQHNYDIKQIEKLGSDEASFRLLRCPDCRCRPFSRPGSYDQNRVKVHDLQEPTGVELSDAQPVASNFDSGSSNTGPSHPKLDPSPPLISPETFEPSISNMILGKESATVADLPPQIQLFKCKTCPAQFNTVADRESHTSAAHNIPCPNCHTCFGDADTLQNHYESEHRFQYRRTIETLLCSEVPLQKYLEATRDSYRNEFKEKFNTNGVELNEPDSFAVVKESSTQTEEHSFSPMAPPRVFPGPRQSQPHQMVQIIEALPSSEVPLKRDLEVAHGLCCNKCKERLKIVDVHCAKCQEKSNNSRFTFDEHRSTTTVQDSSTQTAESPIHPNPVPLQFRYQKTIEALLSSEVPLKEHLDRVRDLRCKKSDEKLDIGNIHCTKCQEKRNASEIEANQCSSTSSRHEPRQSISKPVRKTSGARAPREPLKLYRPPYLRSSDAGTQTDASIELPSRYQTPVNELQGALDCQECACSFETHGHLISHVLSKIHQGRWILWKT
jgi:hypothetical protein